MDSRVGDRPVACNAPFLAGGGEMGAHPRIRLGADAASASRDRRAAGSWVHGVAGSR